MATLEQRLRNLEQDMNEMRDELSNVRTDVAVMTSQGDERTERIKNIENKVGGIQKMALAILASALTTLLAVILNNMVR